MRILALVPGGIDNQILFFPTLETLKQQYPQAALDVLVEPRAKAAYRICKNVDEILLFDYQDRNSLADYLNILGVMRDREYDAAINVGSPWTIATLLWLNGIPTRVGYKGNATWSLSNPVELKSEQYLAQMYHDLVRGLGITTPCPAVQINVPTKDIDWAEIEQKRLDIKDSGYILLYGNSSVSENDNIYPLSSWQKIVRDIEQKNTGLATVLLQTAENKEWVTEMMSVSNKIKTVSIPDMGKLAAIIAGANLILCTKDSSMQLSVAVDTYTIALLNATDVHKYLPSSPKNCLAITSMSGKIADIKPETVLEKMWQG
ncbi:MAG: glycosyltransferase family 9 protein [Pleurocapsa sp.]